MFSPSLTPKATAKGIWRNPQDHEQAEILAQRSNRFFDIEKGAQQNRKQGVTCRFHLAEWPSCHIGHWCWLGKMIWMSNGMPYTSGHSGKVRGCCQAPVPDDLSFVSTQQICQWHPTGQPHRYWLLSAIFFLFFCNCWKYVTMDVRNDHLPWKVCQSFSCTDEKMNKQKPRKPSM